MDIDRYSRLLHASYIATNNYVMAGAMNFYGKTELVKKQERFEFVKFRDEWIKAMDNLRNYENEK
jgi:hypothetical protein